MKKIILPLVLLLSLFSFAQVKGDGKIEERKYDLEPIKDIRIGLYADILIDTQKENGITITADANLFDLIDTEVTNGVLQLDQKKWIQPSTRMKIVIGAPYAKRVELGTNDEIRIINLDRDVFSLMTLNGTIKAEGRLNTLNLGAENGTVDARSLMTDQVFLNIWGMGTAKLNTADYLEVELSKEARLEFNRRPNKIKGDISNAIYKADEQLIARYIRFKIRNNSDNRQNFYVLGPKPDGKTFSYGFPMMPGAVRKENWTTGTKVFRVTGLGMKKLLITISEDAEDKTVDLF